MKVSELNKMVQYLNDITGEKYQLAAAYGGYRLEKVVDDRGTIRTITGAAYLPKKTAAMVINAYIAGTEDANMRHFKLLESAK